MTDQSDTIPAPAIREDVRFVGEPSALGDLFFALSKAQSEFAPIEKGSTAEVKMKAGGSYTFDFAGLDVVIAATRPALNKHGLALMQFPNGNELMTVLAGANGARIESRCFLTEWASPQDFGGVVTYFRRYCWLSIVGAFPAGEDDDSNQASGNQAQVSPRNRQSPPVVRRDGPSQNSGAATSATIQRAVALSKAAGHKGKADLEAFSRKEGCGDLDGQTEVNALRLVAALEALQVQR